MDLSPTARVILGFLAGGPKSGYDIKAIVDRSTRFFWAASYGQIYPELNRLANAGLVKRTAAKKGTRKRTEYTIKKAGRDALAAWLRSPEQAYELRDEGMLKLFFVGHLGTEDARAVLEARRDQHLGVVARLREIEPVASTAERFGPHEILKHGLEFHGHIAKWCDRTLAELDHTDKENR